MRFAYADPPYPGQAKRCYGAHPDYAGEVDHADLIERLCRDYPDGWALSTSAQAIRDVLLLCPADVRVAAWVKSNAPPIRTTGRWVWAWEPVIVRGGRTARGQGAPDVNDGLIAPNVGRMASYEITGQKPPVFSRWVINLLGALPGDAVDDLFSGSGSVGMEIQAVLRQEQLLEQLPLIGGKTYAYRDRAPGRNRPGRDKDLPNRAQTIM